MTRRRACALIALVVVLPVALASAMVSVAVSGQRDVSPQREAARIAMARGLALQGVEVREIQPVDAALLGAIAIRIHSDARTRSALLDTLVSARRTALPSSINARSVGLSADGRTALTGDIRHGVILWALSPAGPPQRYLDAVKLATLEGDALKVSALALASDASAAVIGHADGSVSIWDLADRSQPVERATFGDGGDGMGVRHIGLTPDGKTAVIGFDDGSVTMWDLAKKSRPVRLLKVKAHTTAVEGVGLSADGRTAVTVSERAGFVWDLADPSRPLRVGTLPRTEGAWKSAALTADGRTAVTGSRGSADVWDVTDRAHPIHLASLPGVIGKVFDVALTSDGRTALTGETGGATTLWKLTDPSHPIKAAALNVPANDVQAVALDVDGKTAMVGTTRRGAVVWDMDGINTDPLRDVCADPRFHVQVTRDFWESLTDGEEWPEYFGDGDNFNLCS